MCGHALKIPVTKARARVQGTFVKEGSVLAGTLSGYTKAMTIVLEVDSPAEREQVLHLVRVANESCYVGKAVERPVPVELQVVVNDQPPVALD